MGEVSLGYIIRWKWKKHYDYEPRIYLTKEMAHSEVQRWGGQSVGEYTVVEVFTKEEKEYGL